MDKLKCLPLWASIFCVCAFAAPSQLTVVNLTNLPSDVQVHGSFTGNVAAANSVAYYNWADVVNGCNSAINVCAAEVFISPNTPQQVDVGGVFINLDSGAIQVINTGTPSWTGYQLTSNEAGVIYVKYAQ